VCDRHAYRERSWVATFLSALVRIIIRNQLLQRHQDYEEDAHSHTHRCGSYPEDQILRHCLLPAHFTGTIAQARGDGCPDPDIFVFGLPSIDQSAKPQ
jgi:hypothetical protein